MLICNNIHWGNKDLSLFNGCQLSAWHCPNKIKSNLNCRCQLMCDDWGIPNAKLKFCQCTSTALLCCKNTQLWNCIWHMIIHEWWIWMGLLIPRCYKTSFSSWWLFLCIWDFGHSRDQTGSGSSGIHGELAMSLEAQLSSLSLVAILRYRSFDMCIRTAIYDSFLVLLLIDIQNPHHYWNVVYRQHRFLRWLNS